MGRNHRETRQMTQHTLREQNGTSVQTNQDDNVVTRAQQGHLTLLDWQTANPLQEQARMPKPRRRPALDWYQAGIITLMVSTALAGASALAHAAW